MTANSFVTTAGVCVGPTGTETIGDGVSGAGYDAGTKTIGDGDGVGGVGVGVGGGGGGAGVVDVVVEVVLTGGVDVVTGGVVVLVWSGMR